MKVSEPGLLGSARPSVETVLTDQSRIAEELAVAVESEGIRPWLERVRVLLNARSVSMSPVGDTPIVQERVAVGFPSSEIHLSKDDLLRQGAVAVQAPKLGPN